MKEPTPKYPETSRGRRAGSGAACVARQASEMGETPEERVFRERRNSRRHNRRRAQEQAEQETKQRRENPLFGRNLNPDFARALNTPSEVGGVLARIADGLPRTPDAEGYR
jgi:hypothetical protein